MNLSPKHKRVSGWAVLLFITALLVTLSALLVKQSFFRIFPLYISLFIALLTSKVNRYAFLIGGINSIFYGCVSFYYHIYGGAFTALCFSFPLQIFSFIRWSRSGWKHSTLLKKMSKRTKIWCCVALIFGWVLYYLFMRRLGSASSLFDSMSSLLGMVIPVLQLLKYAEYTVLMVPSGIISCLLYLSLILKGNWEQLPFLVYAVYALCCNIRALFSARKILTEQHSFHKED
jgi:nicotinamide mononucleotide transporter PnuC